MLSFVDSKHKKLSPEEIVAIAAEKTGGKFTADQVKASIAEEISKAKSWVMQEGNTLFVVHAIPNQPTIAVFRALNGDVIKNYLENSIMFAKAIGLAGFKYMVTEFDDPALLKIFHYIGRKQPFHNMGFAIQKTNRGTFKVTANVGDVNKGLRK